MALHNMMDMSRWENTAKTSGDILSDRFIPCRNSTNLDLANLDTDYYVHSKDESKKYSKMLAQTILGQDDVNCKIMSFKKKKPKTSEIEISKSLEKPRAQKKRPVPKTFRKISSTPIQILDAPDIWDDFYINLLDWSFNDVIACALGSSLILSDTFTGTVEILCEAPDNVLISSVKWSDDGSYIAVGTTDSLVSLYDVNTKRKIRAMRGHLSRVGSLAWNTHLLSTGSKDSMIFHHDVRMPKHHIQTLKGHQQEICGLEWSTDGKQLASGGNDDICCIWDASNSSNPRYTFNDSYAAVKALAWCPSEKHLLVTGGGTNDGKIRFYNTATGLLKDEIDTKSQISSLIWSRHKKQLVSSHGFPRHQLTVWDYPSLSKISDLTGHTSRVLKTALSHDGTTVCSAAADETLRFWKIWDKPISKKVKTGPLKLSKLSSLRIR